MTGILDKFHVEHDIHGARLMARTHQLTASSLSDAEIDANIRLLKADLDTCAKAMKRLLKVNSSGSLFEGWPSIRDDNSTLAE